MVVLQHHKNWPWNMERKYSKSHLLQQPKNLIATFENHLSQYLKRTIATWRNKQKRTCKSSKGMGSAPTLTHHLRAYWRNDKFTRPLATTMSLRSRRGWRWWGRGLRSIVEGGGGGVSLRSRGGGRKGAQTEGVAAASMRGCRLS